MFAGGAPPPPSPEKVDEEDRVASGMMMSVVVACVGLWLNFANGATDLSAPSVVQFFTK
ncbi:hypothetical protein V1507DRAFT_440908 [Lipomyces tetrasporus]